MCHAQMHLMSDVTRMAVEIEQFFYSPWTIANLLTELQLRLLHYSFRCRIIHRPPWQGELPGSCAQVVLFNKQDILLLTNWNHKHTLRPFNNITDNLITIWQSPSILIDGQHFSPIDALFCNGQLPSRNTIGDFRVGLQRTILRGRLQSRVDMDKWTPRYSCIAGYIGCSSSASCSIAIPNENQEARVLNNPLTCLKIRLI